MTGFSGSPRDLYFVTDYVSTDLTNFLKRLIGEYNGPGSHEITFGDTACGYACSDHAAWTDVGVPAVHPFETRAGEHNAALHTADDRLGRIDTTGQKQALFRQAGNRVHDGSVKSRPGSLNDGYQRSSGFECLSAARCGLSRQGNLARFTLTMPDPATLVTQVNTPLGIWTVR